MSKFEKLPKEIQEAINAAIEDCFGDEDQEAMAAYREEEAICLLESETEPVLSVDEEEIDDFRQDCVWFQAGWEARGKLI